VNPLVSIIIPCYNAEKWIDKCVRSALEQTYSNVEVIFVDNESKDQSVDIVKDLFKLHPELIIDYAPNIYPNCWDEPKAVGLDHANGDYFTVMGADDYLHPLYIENCMKYIMSAPEQVITFQSPIRGVRGAEEAPVGDIGHYYTTMEEFKTLLLKKCPVNTPTVIYSRKLYDDNLLNTNPEKYGGAADYDLYCQLADHDVFIYPCDRWLGYHYRWHEHQATWNVHREGINYDDMIQTYWRERWTINPS
jgi:glycosyltransferase involved in cell wall biosynthesis